VSNASRRVGTLNIALAHAARLLEKTPILAAEQAGEILKAVPGHPHARLVLGASHRLAGEGWLLNASATYLDAKLTSKFCGTYLPGTTTPLTNCPNQINGGPNNQLPFQFADGTVTTGPLALSGARLPVVPEFKGNVLARYNFAVADWQANVQGAYVYQTSSRRSRVPSAFSSDRGSREVGARGSAGPKSFGSGRRSRTENSTLFFARTKSRPHDLLQVPFIANPALN
jgi:hypothetical protein